MAARSLSLPSAAVAAVAAPMGGRASCSAPAALAGATHAAPTMGLRAFTGGSHGEAIELARAAAAGGAGAGAPLAVDDSLFIDGTYTLPFEWLVWFPAHEMPQRASFEYTAAQRPSASGRASE